MEEHKSIAKKNQPEKKLRREDLKRAPYRGVYTEIARELGMTPQGVLRAVWKFSNPDIQRLLLEKIAERDQRRALAQQRFHRVIETE
jgi:hypothetical protein